MYGPLLLIIALVDYSRNRASCSYTAYLCPCTDYLVSDYDRTHCAAVVSDRYGPGYVVALLNVPQFSMLEIGDRSTCALIDDGSKAMGRQTVRRSAP